MSCAVLLSGKRVLVIIMVALGGCWTHGALGAPLVEPYLERGELAAGEVVLMKELEKNPQDVQAQFGLGVVRFLRAVERLGQAQYRYGLLQQHTRRLPFLRLPLPANERPEEIGYQDARQMIAQLGDDLSVAEATLARVATQEVKLPLHFGRIHLDLNADGEVGPEEELWRIYGRFSGGISEEQGSSFVIAFDGADVHWLRGYCHLLMALCDVLLAHDWHELFERCGQLAYPQVKTPFTYLRDEQGGESAPRLQDFRLVADAIAAIHLINLPVVEPQRMQSALAHLEAMIGQSRLSWQRIMAETDDDHEWIPKPGQSSVIPRVQVRRDMIEGWRMFLDEAELLLQGKKLAPFWRGYRESVTEVLMQRRGVNLRRVFTEPRQFDLVLWVSGTGAAPYLEEGELTDVATWNRLLRVFGGEFLGFALWFN